MDRILLPEEVIFTRNWAVQDPAICRQLIMDTLDRLKSDPVEREEDIEGGPWLDTTSAPQVAHLRSSLAASAVWAIEIRTYRKKASENPPIARHIYINIDPPVCLIEFTRAEVALEELSIKKNADTNMNEPTTSQDDKSKEYAYRYVARQVRKSYRSCKAVKKFEEPRMQFFETFMQEDSFGGIENSVEPVSPKKLRKLPGVEIVECRMRLLEGGLRRVQGA
ncbi:hypothetical protein T440DRAFT_556110 [Plenodomus tracheiphilus IPT5]|uniref:Uncharacterized protein n=1 Tax=Plenodomus tracheiphilus IPT5 TaxID=1408161 RepID=A0A6A7B4C0_9PLEO|nr:hypothetical protein T440DRAFT_556110 [Plenodomus tracheiphilus IPT5]